MRLFIQTQEESRLDLMLNFKHIIFIINIFSFVYAQNPSGREYRRTASHNGNQVKTVFGNWGVIGQPAQKGPRGAWKNPNNGYIGDVSPPLVQRLIRLIQLEQLLPFILF